MTKSQETNPVVNRERKLPVWLIFLGGLIVGVIGFGSFHFLGMNGYTNTLEMCISCHEMEGVYKEYQRSVHYKNRSGVRVICSNCHAPHDKAFGDYVDKFLDKVFVGGRHLFHHLIGTYPDAESFEKSRYRLAQIVLKEMRADDSKACRHCHTYEAMQFADQQRSAASKHERMMQDNSKTCIDCHSGIVHEEPEEPAKSKE